MTKYAIFTVSFALAVALLLSACAPRIKQLPYRQSYPISPTIEEIIRVTDK